LRAHRRRDRRRYISYWVNVAQWCRWFTL